MAHEEVTAEMRHGISKDQTSLTKSQSTIRLHDKDEVTRRFFVDNNADTSTLAGAKAYMEDVLERK